MIVLVTGGREYSNKEHLFKVLDRAREKKGISVVVHGNAKGADSLACEWAKSRGVQEVIIPANWKGLGKRAGMDRNKFMLLFARPDFVIAFEGGKGTAHMVEIATEKGVPLFHA